MTKLWDGLSGCLFSCFPNQLLCRQHQSCPGVSKVLRAYHADASIRRHSDTFVSQKWDTPITKARGSWADKSGLRFNIDVPHSTLLLSSSQLPSPMEPSMHEASYEKLIMTSSSKKNPSSSSEQGALGSRHSNPPLAVSPQVWAIVLTQVHSQQSPSS